MSDFAAMFLFEKWIKLVQFIAFHICMNRTGWRHLQRIPLSLLLGKKEAFI